MAKKTTTPATTDDAPNYGHYGSYKLTDEQIRQAVRTFEWDLLEDDGDNKAGILCALLRSFTYTTDGAERESMLLAAESVLMPVTEACESAMTKLAIKTHRQLVREDGIQ
jgi:hypothetical protein